MLSSLSKLPGKSYRRENITLLTVSSDSADFNLLRQVFRHEDWKIEHAQSCQEALRTMERTKPAVVLCDCVLPDGGWKRVLQHSFSLESAPMMVVVSTEADNSLWAEVLNLGGYDILLKPFEKTEVIQVVSMAWRHWKESLQRQYAHMQTPVPVLCQ